MTTGGYLHFLLKSDTHVYYCAPNMEWGSEYHTSPVFQWPKAIQMSNSSEFECQLKSECFSPDLRHFFQMPLKFAN